MRTRQALASFRGSEVGEVSITNPEAFERFATMASNREQDIESKKGEAKISSAHARVAARLAEEASEEQVDEDLPVIDKQTAARYVAGLRTKSDAGLSRLATHLLNLYQSDPQGSLTIGEVRRLQAAWKQTYGKTAAHDVLATQLVKQGFLNVDVRRLSKLASGIRTQQDFDVTMREAGLAGSRPDQIKARSFVLALLNKGAQSVDPTSGNAPPVMSQPESLMEDPSGMAEQAAANPCDAGTCDHQNPDECQTAAQNQAEMLVESQLEGKFSPESIEVAKQYLDTNDVPGHDSSIPATDDDAEQLLDSGWQPFRDASLSRVRGENRQSGQKFSQSPIVVDAKGRLVSRASAERTAQMGDGGTGRNVSVTMQLENLGDDKAPPFDEADAEKARKIKEQAAANPVSNAPPMLTATRRVSAVCPACNGSGKDGDSQGCPKCSSTGKIARRTRLTAGIREKILSQFPVEDDTPVLGILSAWDSNPDTTIDCENVTRKPKGKAYLDQLEGAGVVRALGDDHYVLTQKGKTAGRTDCPACHGKGGILPGNPKCANCQAGVPDAEIAHNQSINAQIELQAGRQEAEQFVRDYAAANPDQRKYLKDKCQRGQVQGVEWNVVQWMLPVTGGLVVNDPSAYEVEDQS